MDGRRSELTNPGRRLPDLRLRPADGGAEVGIRAPGRKAPVLALLHGAGCESCREYVRSLEQVRSCLEDWDGRILLVVPEASGSPQPRSSFPVLVDEAHRLAHALSVQPPATVVADQWGEIHWAGEAGREHRFPPPEELVEWVRYLAVQCPECQGEAL